MGGVTILEHGRQEYAWLLGSIRADPWLVARLWADAESTPDELDRPGTVWCVALVGGAPAAWCAATPDGAALRAHSNYEHPHHRGQGLYEAVYARRHRDVVQPARLPAVTYLFAQPIPLHEADGWQRTGVEGPGEVDGNWWWELSRDPTG
ncbi:hypothetical protein E1258_09485 [Micromonospora sp. KC207]|uniref:hypothetical protein n=1 Tax=Micromonospora sp. KC207 TaxID=2530377 RepID=UPI00104BEB8E|nr:hypothetical protein [Micromonospora sp. KC207]TDC63868.1 hypothetical protein E1258_09485 [Micromonospora sp. KC207]